MKTTTRINGLGTLHTDGPFLNEVRLTKTRTAAILRDEEHRQKTLKKEVQALIADRGLVPPAFGCPVIAVDQRGTWEIFAVEI